MRLTASDTDVLVAVDKRLESLGVGIEDELRKELVSTILRLRRDLYDEDLWKFLEEEEGAVVYVPGHTLARATRVNVGYIKRACDEDEVEDDKIAKLMKEETA